MKKYRLLRMNSRGGRYYAEEIATGLRKSLKTADRDAAEKLLHAMNEAERNPHLNQLMGQTYLAGTDPLALTRTWQTVFTAIIDSKPEGSDNRYRWVSVSMDKAYKPILALPLLKTSPEVLLAVLKKGTVSTNVFLRRAQNFALDMGWLPLAHPAQETVPQGPFRAPAGHYGRGPPSP